jgi:hypothetical protein
MLGPVSLTVREVCRSLWRTDAFCERPHRATGFTVRTADLKFTIWAPVFGVCASETLTETFVFKGCVQSTKSPPKTAVRVRAGRLRGGRGVRAAAGRGPKKLRGEWATRVACSRPRGVASGLEIPQRRLRPRKIADLWTDRYMPEEASKLAARRKLEAWRKTRVPFTKAAWARPSVSVVADAGTKSLSSEQEVVT